MFSYIKRNIKNMDKFLLFLTIVLFIWGLLSIVSSSSRVAVLDYNLPVYHYFMQQVKMIGIGLFGAFIIINMPSEKYWFWVQLAFVIILGILLYLSFNGSDTRGAQNWVSLFGFTFQPSEFSKPIIIVYLSMIFERFYKKLKNPKEKNNEILAWIIFVGCFIPVIVFFQKDFGTMMILLLIFGVLFWSSPIRKEDKWKMVRVLILVVILGAGIMYKNKGQVLSNAQLARFDFYNPCSKYETGGYQICNGFIAINDGGLLGLGLGKSKQKYSYIPEPHTDSIFAIIAEENGFIRSSFAFLFYIALLYRILTLSMQAISMRGKFICLGVATYIFAHIFINLGGLFGVIPLTGVPLPFFSYVGSFTISLICSLALVQRVYIETKVKTSFKKGGVA